ncbi:hypothetical protein [Methanolapillus ohkumae]|uniref:Uncharacterized protein n=1 Tax=Methanolapillus ohkumae TaxID=3028298 RepID=A0AA96V7X1_9EURY|nr:hypothetical protein MsAm2_16370 [Methanosarcinaceae archaeon Am2]
MPKYKILGGKHFGTKFTNPKRKSSDELLIYEQIDDLIIDIKNLNGKEIAYTTTGEIVVSEDILNLFKENNLTGYQIRTVKNFRKNYASKKRYFQIMTDSLMPSVSPATIIKSKSGLLSYKNLVEKSLYYNKNEVFNLPDFNKSLEYFGSTDGKPYFIQKLWIISANVHKILINSAKQKESDFISTFLVEDAEKKCNRGY